MQEQAPALQKVDVTQWHAYRLEWSEKRVVWYVDDVLVFESPVSPNASRPLGVIIWIDNQYAAFTPEGKIAFGVLEGGNEWLEIEDIVISEK
ncbi:MAG: family 16 glycosylhydrolase [Anaerolineales bacterium]|nr:family 16 glycosylhydrolase [Anaerolineales bacterium]